MKIIASLFSLPLALSSCGTNRVQDKDICPLIDMRRTHKVESFEDAHIDVHRSNIITHVYIISDKSGKLIYLGENRGYNVTESKSPKTADEGMWVNMRDPRTNESKPVFVNNNIVVSSFRLEM